MVTASSLSTATRPSWTWFLVFPIFLLDGQILLQPATAFSIFQRHNKYDASLTVIRQIPSRETSCTTSSRRPSFPFSLIGGGRSRRRRSGGKYNIYEDSCLALYSSSKSSQQQSEVEDGDFVEAEDLPAIQALFNKYCDKDGLMTKADLTSIPVFADMLEEEDLLLEELNDIWDAAPKFPEVNAANIRIDVDSFVQIYRDVDDLFEDEDDDVEPSKPSDDVKGDVSATASIADDEDSAEDEENDDVETVEAELEGIYSSICDKDGLISKEALRNWNEVKNLFDEELLGEDEFDDLWRQTQKSPGSSDQLDVDGFLSFNVALDGLFEFDDMEGEEEADYDDDDELSESDMPPSPAAVQKPKSMVEGEDLPPGVLFAALANEDYQVGMEELKYWSELQEMLNEGDLLQEELEAMFNKAKGSAGNLDEDGFMKLYEGIDDLFEDDEDEEPDILDDVDEEEATTEQTESDAMKTELLELIAFIDEDIEGGLPCGLDSTEPEQKRVLKVVSALEEQPSNLVRQRQGNIQPTDLAGSWDLLYSSSSAMKFNKGLSGLGGSFPNGRFAGLRQELKATKYLVDMEYIERIEVNPSSASFDVKVNGDWDIRTSVSLFTGLPSIVLNVVPDRVTYGPTSTRADHWKSLGPLNMLDLTYLDDDIRVMRGCTSSDTIFVFKRA